MGPNDTVEYIQILKIKPFHWSFKFELMHFHWIYLLIDVFFPSTDLDKAKMLSQKILISLPSHITSMSFTSHQLIQLITVNLFTMSHARRKLTDQSMNSTEKADLEKKEELGMDERRGYDLVFNMTSKL